MKYLEEIVDTIDAIKKNFILLVVEIGLLYLFGILTYSDGMCLENNNWYWATNTDSSTVYNCPSSRSDPSPASAASKIKFDIFQGMQAVVPITGIAGLVVALKQKKKLEH